VKGLVMSSGRKYPEELKQRAIRLVGEARESDENLSLHAAVVSDIEIGRGSFRHVAGMGPPDRYQWWPKAGCDDRCSGSDQRVGA
jgi:transposase-like protein